MRLTSSTVSTWLVGLVEGWLVRRERIRVAVTACERYATAGGDNAGAGDESLGNTFSQGKLRIGRIGFAGIPHHGKPVLQPELKVATPRTVACGAEVIRYDVDDCVVGSERICPWASINPGTMV
jgi:hypothetical protein